jgi:hypothetical protein
MFEFTNEELSDSEYEEYEDAQEILADLGKRGTVHRKPVNRKPANYRPVRKPPIRQPYWQGTPIYNVPILPGPPQEADPATPETKPAVIYNNGQPVNVNVNNDKGGWLTKILDKSDTWIDRITNRSPKIQGGVNGQLQQDTGNGAAAGLDIDATGAGFKVNYLMIGVVGVIIALILYGMMKGKGK